MFMSRKSVNAKCKQEQPISMVSERRSNEPQINREWQASATIEGCQAWFSKNYPMLPIRTLNAFHMQKMMLSVCWRQRFFVRKI